MPKELTMPVFRYILIAFGVLNLVMAVGFFWQLPWATALWPWPDSRLSYIFLASIAAAIGAPTLWLALSEEYGALRGGLVNLGLIGVGMATAGFSVYAAEGNAGALALALGGLVLLAVNAGLFLVMRRYPLRDPRPTPGPVRVSFMVYTAALVGVGVALVLGGQVFPWPLKPASALVFGSAFLGAACYFAYGVLQPRWHNARGQLWAFLAYDLVLILPFLAHFATVQSGHLLSLIIYIVVLVQSGGLAVYYLFINPQTRSAEVP
jgi:hypothetical protein